MFGLVLFGVMRGGVFFRKVYGNVFKGVVFVEKFKGFGFGVFESFLFDLIKIGFRRLLL